MPPQHRFSSSPSLSRGCLWAFSQSKAPFSSHEAFMNRHLPPLLSIPLTAALLFFRPVNTAPVCPMSSPYVSSFNRLIDFLPFTVFVCMCVCISCVPSCVPSQQHKQSVCPRSELSRPSGKCLCCENRETCTQIDGVSLSTLVYSTFFNSLKVVV